MPAREPTRVLSVLVTTAKDLRGAAALVRIWHYLNIRHGECFGQESLRTHTYIRTNTCVSTYVCINVCACTYVCLYQRSTRTRLLHAGIKFLHLCTHACFRFGCWHKSRGVSGICQTCTYLFYLISRSKAHECRTEAKQKQELTLS